MFRNTISSSLARRHAYWLLNTIHSSLARRHAYYLLDDLACPTGMHRISLSGALYSLEEESKATPYVCRHQAGVSHTAVHTPSGREATLKHGGRKFM